MSYVGDLQYFVSRLSVPRYSFGLWSEIWHFFREGEILARQAMERGYKKARGGFFLAAKFSFSTFTNRRVVTSQLYSSLRASYATYSGHSDPRFSGGNRTDSCFKAALSTFPPLSSSTNFESTSNEYTCYKKCCSWSTTRCYLPYTSTHAPCSIGSEPRTKIQNAESYFSDLRKSYYFPALCFTDYVLSFRILESLEKAESDRPFLRRSSDLSYKH